VTAVDVQLPCKVSGKALETGRYDRAYQGSSLLRVDLDGKLRDGCQELLGRVCFQKADKSCPHFWVDVQEAQDLCEGIGWQPRKARQACSCCPSSSCCCCGILQLTSLITSQTNLEGSPSIAGQAVQMTCSNDYHQQGTVTIYTFQIR